MEKSKQKTDAKGKSEDNAMFTRGTKSFQKIEETVATTALSFAHAISKGLSTYLDARKKSAESKKDGAVQDMVVNVAKGVTETVKESSNIITDTAEAFDEIIFSTNIRKRMKNQIGKAVDTLGLQFKE